MPFQQKHLVYLITLVLIICGIFMIPLTKENYSDFSQGLPRATLDTMCYQSDDITGKTPPTFACNPPSSHPADNCGQCDGLCTSKSIGKVYPSPVTKPVNYPLITSPTGFYHFLSINNSYLAYDLNSLDTEGLQLYLAKPVVSNSGIPDLSWKLEKEVGFYRIATCREPRLYLYAQSNGKLGMSYFRIGEWILGQKSSNEIIIRSQNPIYYLTSPDNRQVQLGSNPQTWRLISNAPCSAIPTTSLSNNGLIPITNPINQLPLSNNGLIPIINPINQLPLSNNGLIPVTNPINQLPLSNNGLIPIINPINQLPISLTETYDNIFQFPDKLSGSKMVKEWNQYYSDFWNGEYVYKSTTDTNKDYLTITLHADGQGIVATKSDVWQILSVSPDLLYGENRTSYIYLEMLTAEKGGKYYDPNRPQVRIITKNKNTGKLESLVGNNPNNLNAYSAKIGTVGQNVKRYPSDTLSKTLSEKFTNQLPAVFYMNGVVPLDITLGYQVPKVDLNMANPLTCSLSPPTKVPVFSGYWGKVDTSGVLKRMGNLGPMEIQYSYLYKCSGQVKESVMSPVLKMETSVGALGAYYDAIVYIYGDVGVDTINVYVKGPGDIQFLLNQNVKSKVGQVEVLVSPRIVKDALNIQSLTN